MSKHLPEQVRKQSAAVQALYADMGMGEDNDGLDPGVTVAPNKKGEPATVAANKPDKATPLESEERSDKGKSNKNEDWEHKYKTLQGMHNTEMQKLRVVNQDLGGKVSNLEQLIAGLSSPGAAKAPVEVQVGSLVTKEDQESYGGSIEVMRRVSREEMVPVMQQLKAIQSMVSKMTEVMPKVDSIVNTQVRTATEKFWARVEAAIPKWAEINRDDDFATWLFLPDIYSGTIRQDLLEDAQKKGDAERVINIFKLWIAETGYDAGNSETNTAHAGARSELESQIAPGTTRAVNRPVDSGNKKTITREYISSFYNDVSRGKYKGRDGDRAKIEADIFSAKNEGRIV